MSGGILFGDQIVPIYGVNVVPPASHGGPAWARLDAGDYAVRRTSWIRQIILHTTKGIWPQTVIPGAGPPGHGESVARFWQGDPTHSSAPIVVDCDGTVACLSDLARTAPYHAEMSNDWSIGIEMYQLADGSIYEATLKATAQLVLGLAWLARVPLQVPTGPYRNIPLARMETRSGETRRQTGGPNLVGVFGHRDNTERRGRGDPGDAIFDELELLGAERLDFNAEQDLDVGRDRQMALNARGEHLTVDGVCGPGSWAAMLRQGFSRWRDVR